MRDTNFINLWALALVLASAVLSIAQAALPVGSVILDRSDQFLGEEGKVLPVPKG